jgi:hypothetical protein
LAAQNLRLVDMEVTSVDGGMKYSGVWRSGTDGQYLWVGKPWDEFEAKWNELSAQDLRLVALEIYFT